MDYLQLVADMSPDMYARLKRALELGRWPDGRPLSAQQKEETLQAVIAWGEMHLDASERVGFVDRGSKGGSNPLDDASPQTLQWREDPSNG